jgi:hypothetical protein
VWLCLLFLAFCGAVEIGCKDACASAQDRINARYKACDFPSSSTTQTAAATTCDSTTATYLDCLADCTESASCTALHGTDVQAGADFGKCTADCKSK